MTTTKVDLGEKVDKAKVSVLNSVGGDASFLFHVSNKSVCRSDVDAEMILYVPFLEQVKLQSIIMEAPDGEEPTAIKFFVNRPSLGFSDVDDGCTEALALKPGDCTGKELKLKPGKFQAVNHLYIFVKNEEGDKAALTRMTFIGQTVASTDLRNIKKSG